MSENLSRTESDPRVEAVFLPSCNEVITIQMPPRGDRWLEFFTAQPASGYTQADISLLDQAAETVATGHYPDADFVDLANDVDPESFRNVAMSAGAQVLETQAVIADQHYPACAAPIISF